MVTDKRAISIALLLVLFLAGIASPKAFAAVSNPVGYKYLFFDHDLLRHNFMNHVTQDLGRVLESIFAIMANSRVL